MLICIVICLIYPLICDNLIYIKTFTRSHKEGSMINSDNFKKGVVELMALKLLQSGDKYGYQIVQEFAKLSGGKFTIHESS